MVTPYYEDESVTLYHGDCLSDEIAPHWLAADVLVTDPPYGMAYESNRNRNKKNVKLGRPVMADDSTEVRDAALALWGDRPALVFGKWTVARPAATRARLIWDKRVQGTGDVTLPWGPAEEEIYVLGSGFTGKREGNVISVQMLMSADRNRPDHPTPKPLGLMSRLIEKCPPGVVADPFAGSGATLVAARDMGRRAVGVEVEERYCELIAKRLAQGILSLEGA